MIFLNKVFYEFLAITSSIFVESVDLTDRLVKFAALLVAKTFENYGREAL